MLVRKGRGFESSQFGQLLVDLVRQEGLSGLPGSDVASQDIQTGRLYRFQVMLLGFRSVEAQQVILRIKEGIDIAQGGVIGREDVDIIQIGQEPPAMA